MTTKNLIIAGLGLLVLGGCGDKGGDTANSGATPGASAGVNKGESMDIAVIPKGSTHDYWKHVKMGANDAGKELGVNIIFNGPEKEDDKQSQIAMMETMISKGVKGIVLAPLDYDALAQPIEDAVKQGIPVVIIDSGVKTDKYLAMVSTDNENGGKIDADEMIRLLGGKGNVAILRYQAGSASTDAREKGFLDEIKAKAPGIKIVSENQYAGATRETAAKASENLLASYRKADGSLNLDGIYTPNESSTYGMMTVLQQNHWAGKVKFVGFDAAPELIDGLKKGDINALVVQDPLRMGHDGVKVLVEYLRTKKEGPKMEDTGATLVTKENMDKPEVSKLITPATE